MRNIRLSKIHLIILTWAAFTCQLKAQDTFSIVAVDSVTGEVGSAGASCLGSSTIAPRGAYLISGVIPGRGAIHTQAQWDQENQANARNHMLAGESPQQIIDWLEQNDANNDPFARQYGIVDLNGGHPRSAGYTGSNTLTYKNHITGPGYAIQGNILLGQQILDSIEARFLRTEGELAERLMSALQGANVIGADSRCATPNESSSLSSFIRVAKPYDTTGMMYLDIWMTYVQGFSSKVPKDPIDSLQILFNKWKLTASDRRMVKLPPHHVLYYEPDGRMVFDLSVVNVSAPFQITVFDVIGRKVFAGQYQNASFTLEGDLPGGVYFYRLSDSNEQLFTGKIYAQ